MKINALCIRLKRCANYLIRHGVDIILGKSMLRVRELLKTKKYLKQLNKAMKKIEGNYIL